MESSKQFEIRGQRVATLSSMPVGMRWPWRHRNTTIIPVSGSTKVEGLLSAVHPTSFPEIIKHRKAKNAHWKHNEECELYAPEKKCFRRAVILVHDDAAREVRAVD